MPSASKLDKKEKVRGAALPAHRPHDGAAPKRRERAALAALAPGLGQQRRPSPSLPPLRPCGPAARSQSARGAPRRPPVRCPLTLPPHAAPPARSQYHERLCSYLSGYEKAFLVHADNVGSQQFQDIRRVSRAVNANAAAASPFGSVFALLCTLPAGATPPEQPRFALCCPNRARPSQAHPVADWQPQPQASPGLALMTSVPPPHRPLP
jgi:hypothetical protein